MKPVVFLLILFLSACASQNNAPATQQNQAKQTKIEPSVKDQSSQPTQNETKQSIAVADQKDTPEETSTTNPANKATETNNSDPNKKEMYLCTYDSIYKVYAASSVETDGGDLLVTIDKDQLIVTSRSPEIPGTYHLKLRRKSNLKIFAATKSKQFIYSVSSGNFVFNTGIGPSGFNISKGGHTGRQMRASGKCARI